jgi:hypothetical protein
MTHNTKEQERARRNKSKKAEEFFLKKDAMRKKKP